MGKLRLGESQSDGAQGHTVTTDLVASFASKSHTAFKHSARETQTPKPSLGQAGKANAGLVAEILPVTLFVDYSATARSSPLFCECGPSVLL